MEGSNPNLNNGEILQTFRNSQGYIQAPSSTHLAPKNLKSRALHSRSKFKPSISADHQISNSFFGPMDFSHPQSQQDFYSAEEEGMRSDSEINIQTPNSESSSHSQERYPSPLSASSIQPTTLAPREVPVLEHSPLGSEVQTEHEFLIPHRPAPLPPLQPPNLHIYLSTPKPKPRTKRFMRIRNFFSNLDDKYEAHIARGQIDKKVKGLVKAKDEGEKEGREMEKTRREVKKARKTQRGLISRKKSERERLTANRKIGWKSTLQRKFRNLSLSLPTLSFPWSKNKKKAQQKQLQMECEEREKAFERRYQRAEARRAMRERERGGVLGRRVFEGNQRPFEDMGTARRESRFKETIREVGSESESDEFYDEDEDEEYDSSNEEEIAGQARERSFSYLRHRHTVS